MKELSKIFGSEIRVKLMRLFLLNDGEPFDGEMLGKRIRVTRAKASREATLLSSIGFLKKKTFYKDVVRRKKKGKKKTSGWQLNPEFHYNNSLKGLLVEEEFLNKKDLVKRFRPAGKIKLFVVSGVFMREKSPESRVDMLIVGDHLRKRFVEDTVKKLQSEIGKELSYAVFNSQEYKYRLEMYDKLVRDIMDYPHELLIDSNALSTPEFTKA